MSINLLDSVTALFNHDLVSKAANSLGESHDDVSRVLSAGIPSLLSGIVSSAATDGGANVLNLSKQAASSGVLDNVWNLFGGSGSSGNLLSTGSNLLAGLMGTRLGGLTGILSSFTGVKQSTTSTILSAIAPVALGYIGKHAITNNLSAGGVLNFLNSQKSQITNALPAGLNLQGIVDGIPARPASTVRTTYSEPEKTGSKWLWPLLLGLLAIGLLWYFMRGCNNEVTAPVVPDSVTTTKPPVDTAVAPAPVASYKVKLPDGSELNAFKGGIEDRLVSFLNDPSTKAGNDVWFDFDNLNFETNSATITTESQAQINNIAAILKAYPAVNIKIGGYTDVTGNAAANKKLSQDRADATVAAIKAGGGAASQILGGEGYGSQYAKAAAAAPDEEKKMDRRIAVSVRKK